MLRSLARVLVVATLAALAVPVFALAADQPIPLDRDGLPAWEVREWTDLPVRFEVADAAALERLLQTVPLAAFSREDVRPAHRDPKRPGLVVETRVTEAELTALERAGLRPERLRDVFRENREAAERLWADMYAGKAVGVRTDPLNYVPTNDQLGQMLQQLAADHPGLASYFTWGQSVQGRTLHGLVISDNVDQNEVEPEIRYSSTMHGDEIVGLVLTVNLAYYLLEHYQEPGYEDVTEIVDTYELHLMPGHNPDGTAAGQRYNANGVDLNRNFPEPSGTHPITERENLAYIAHALDNHFVVSLNYHGGALVMNYVWDYTYTLAPDNDACIEMCLDYSELNLPMYNGNWDQGITNGAQWYRVDGSVQDWSYDQTDCIDTTCEVSNVKWPSNSSLPGFWDDNRESMLAYMRTTLIGTIHGVVTDAETGLPLDARISLVGNEKPTHTDPENGDYYKYAASGTYDVVFEATGYATQTITGVDHTWGEGTELDVALQPVGTGEIHGTVTDLAGEGLDATVELYSWPQNELVATATADAASGGAYAIEIFYGDYTVTAIAEDHFQESVQVTVGETPVEVNFELGGAITINPIAVGFESGIDPFSGDWFVSGPGFQSDHALTDSEGSYPHNADLIAEADQALDLVDVIDPTVTFMARWNIESTYDAVFFEISTNGGASWTPIEVPGYTEPATGSGVQEPAGVPVFDGSQATWVACEVDLSDHIGESDVRLRFRLSSDYSVAYDGFWVDDFQVTALIADDVTGAETPEVAVRLQAYPNPFNPQTTLRLVNPRTGSVEVAVYDLQGRLVRTLVAGDLPAGEHTVAWDGTDQGGRRLGSGVYVA
ncbi:T9SS type A sorting domain-containing protein, partial [bacterium]|nr:T9SS type A sorting domain-containing protein [bacterium]